MNPDHPSNIGSPPERVARRHGTSEADRLALAKAEMKRARRRTRNARIAGDDVIECELCCEPIRLGAPCHYGFEMIVCEACAPTYEEIREPGFWIDMDTGAPVPEGEIEAQIAAHLTAGGALTDKIVEPRT